MYSLKCLSADGDSVTEGREFESIEAAWDRSSEMGSRWFFYPIHFVTEENGRIADVPCGCSKEWVGHTLSSFSRKLKKNKRVQRRVMAWIDGRAPLALYP